jgi:hypothetical protein
MRLTVMNALLALSVARGALTACRRSSDSGIKETPPAAIERKEEPSAAIQRAEMLAADRVERVCDRPFNVYAGSIAVNARDYVHAVERGSDYVDEAVSDLDKVLTKSKRIRFTLDYPFEKPFAGSVDGQITLRRTIDAIRSGFRTMYEGSTEREIPKMMNKDVSGNYGHAFHAIDDLVIERIDLCADDSLAISIGS